VKVTFDHNCLIHLENGGGIADCIRTVVKNPAYECFVVNVGATEMRRFGVRPDNYGAFEELLARIGIAELPRLDPIAIWNVTFWNHCIFARKEDSELFSSIQSALFSMDDPASDAEVDERKALNRLCDALTMWCHINYANDAFLTTDGNFFKATKHPKLIALGAGFISHPCEL
jgi:hypothetical protein